MQRNNTKPFGAFGEKFAVSLLKKNGYKIITTNFRSRFGEIDIIAVDKDTLVFVEVKTRRSVRQGLPEEAVDERKLEKIRMTSEYFVRQNPSLPRKKRIDVVALLVEKKEVKRAKIIKVSS